MKSGTFKTMSTPLAAVCSSEDRKKIKKNHEITTEIFNVQMSDKKPYVLPYLGLWKQVTG